MSNYLGIEFGSTRIKASLIDETYCPIAAGSHSWESRLENGILTYPEQEIRDGLCSTLDNLLEHVPGKSFGRSVGTVGISGMMHGYLAFDKDWNLLVPFRTWKNTITGKAASELTALFGFNIPQRWSIAHLYQAILNEEPHVRNIAHITTLAGYVHHALTGENLLGVGEASGMFPVDGLHYDPEMIQKFRHLIEGKYPWDIAELLPEIRTAGEPAGVLTREGCARIGHLLPVGRRKRERNPPSAGP